MYSCPLYGLVMPDFDYSLSPVDKTAAVVTGQNGCSGLSLSDEQIRENLVKKAKLLENQILSLPKNHPRRKSLGKEKADLCLQINAIRAKKRAKGVENYFINAAREKLPKYVFDGIMSLAVTMLKRKE